MTKNKSRPIALLAAGLLWAGLAQAQESVNATGGDATGSGGTVAYSVGQVVYTTNTGTLLVQCSTRGAACLRNLSPLELKKPH